MTGFDIAANPQAAVAAVKAITRSFEELQRQVRAVNGELNKLSPEIRDEAQEANRRLHAVIHGRMGRPFRQGLELSQQGGTMPLMIDPSRVYPSSQHAGQRTMTQMARVVGIPTGGAGGGGGGGGGPAEEAGGAEAGGMGAAMGGAFRMASRYILPLAGITAGISTLAKGVSDAQQQAVQVDALYRTLGDVSSTFKGVQTQVEDFGHGLGIAQAESVRLMQAFAGIANISDAVRLKAEGRQAAGMARAFGLSPESVTGPFASMRFLGQGGAGAGGARDLALMITDAVSRSKMWAKSDEVIAALARFTQTASSYLVDAAPTKQFADLYATLNATGKPGFMGQNAENLISRMDASFRQGGGSEASKVFLWRALGESDPFKFKMDRSRGLLNPDSTPLMSAGETPLDKMMKYFEKNSKGLDSDTKAGVLSEILGIDANQAQAFMGLNLGGGGMGSLAAAMKRAGVDMASVQPDSYKLLAQIQQGEGLEGIRQQLLKEPGLSDKQRDQLNASPDQDTLMQVAATIGRVHTVGSDQLQATSDIRDAVLELGRGIIKPIQSIQEILAGSLGLIAKPINLVSDQLTTGPHGGGGAQFSGRTGGLFGPMGNGAAGLPISDHASLAAVIDAIHNPTWVLRLPGGGPVAPPNYFSRSSGNGEPQPAGQPNMTVQ